MFVNGPPRITRVTCSCGWEREASSAWAASAILRLHVQHLGDPTIEHTLTIEEPPANPAHERAVQSGGCEGKYLS